ncbi:T-cell surface glycoprotein CD1e, membrane-associated-like isoform X3 [Callospermophilus lateralis]|uniref:T-cell surface glycoprotein CD1e, membrane-associated-like isoform X3 n=1 Tax=Callospermophilus lateralis TaxID=76772 RepID=UPI004038F6A5
MLLLRLLLFEGLLCHGQSTTAPQALRPHHAPAEEPRSFRLVHISSFANHSWASTQASGWLGDLEILGWDKVLGSLEDLKPWSLGNFSKEEVKSLQSLFQMYFHGFIRVVQAFSSQFQFEYPLELQTSSGCRLHAGQAPEGFFNGAYQGSDFLSFQGGSWQPSPRGGSRAQNVCRVLNLYEDIKEIVQSLLDDTCPRFLAGVLAAGKSELERQVKPEVWLSSGPSPGPGRLLLVCHVSGFYPKPLWVMWMRGGYAILLLLMCLAAIVTLVLLFGLHLWCKKSNSAFPLGAQTQDPRNPAHQLPMTSESWIKKRILKWKTSLNQLW